ncbi:MAG: hypothetical protein ABH879_07120 [archaeon]
MGIIKAAVKVLFLLSFIFGAVISIAGYRAYEDAVELRERLPSEPSRRLLIDDGRVLACVNSSFAVKSAQLSTNAAIEEFQGAFDQGNLEKIRGSNYKLFIIDIDSFDSEGQVEMGEDVFERAELIAILRSANATDGFSAILADSRGLPIESVKGPLMEQFRIDDDSQMKGLILRMLISDKMDEEGSAFIFSEYRKGNIQIYEETIVFRFIKHLPASIMDRIST